MNAKHDSQRGWFAAELYEAMEKDDRIWVLTGDLGWAMLDNVRDDFPTRFINCGASEQAMIGIATGLALQGKIPFVYSITPFLVYRPFEWLRNYLHHEQIPVRLVGSGIDTDYSHDGFTHHSCEIRQVMACVPRIKCHWPELKEDVPPMVEAMIREDRPSFIGLRR